MFDMHAGVQSLLNGLTSNTPLEQNDFGDAEYTPRSPEEFRV